MATAVKRLRGYHLKQVPTRTKLPNGGFALFYSRASVRMLVRGGKVYEISVVVPGRKSCMDAVRWAGFRGRTGFPHRKRWGCLWPGISMRHRLAPGIKGRYEYATARLTLTLKKIPLPVVKITLDQNKLGRKGFAPIRPLLRFDLYNWKLTPLHRKVLKKVAGLLKRRPRLRLCIQAHASSGEIRYSIDPSRKRGQAVRNLLATLSVRSGRIRNKHYGESTPFHSNRTASGRAANRRVVLVLLKGQKRCPGPQG